MHRKDNYECYEYNTNILEYATSVNLNIKHCIEWNFPWSLIGIFHSTGGKFLTSDPDTTMS